MRILWILKTCIVVMFLVLAFFICIRWPNVIMIFPKEAYDNWPDPQPYIKLVGPTLFLPMGFIRSILFCFAAVVSKRMPFCVFVCCLRPRDGHYQEANDGLTLGARFGGTLEGGFFF